MSILANRQTKADQYLQSIYELLSTEAQKRRIKDPQNITVILRPTEYGLKITERNRGVEIIVKNGHIQTNVNGGRVTIREWGVVPDELILNQIRKALRGETNDITWEVYDIVQN